ncbi:MAG: ATP-binding protein [Eubacteriales bacterium]|nr:ATP-binding protein [Eubacteriales bacterium]
MIEMKMLPDIPRIYTALAEWLACVICLMEVKPRLEIKKNRALSVGVLALLAAFLVLTPGLQNVLWILCMMVALGIMYAFIYVGAEVNWKDAAYYCARAFVLAEFAASLEWQIDCYASRYLKADSIVCHMLVLAGTYTVVFTLGLRLYGRYREGEEALNVTNGELLSYIIIGVAVFSMSNMGFVSGGTIFGGSYAEEIFNVRTLVDLGGVAIMYAYHVRRADMRVRRELESVQSILHNQYVQYRQSREAMEVINYKYHDLKHHIIALRAEEDDQKRNAYLDQMEVELQDYESQNKTGNKVLDVLLATKGLYCKKHGITMTNVVDGALFDFMNTMDICSIFGNALDNAIECVLKIGDKQKRLIHVSAFSQKNFLIIRFENYYEGTVELGTDLPATTKEDSRFHGYGLKSIRYTVQKYGGAVDLSTQDQWFNLKILIPMQHMSETV